MANTQIRLSPQQQRVVDHRGGHLQVIACAGSGKTESISRRVASLITEGAEPSSIVAFTFTERAAAELKERIVRRVEDSMGSDFLDRLGPMFVGTVHSYCFRILQDHVPRYGNYDVLDDHRHAGLLSREYRRLGLSRLGARHWAPIRDFIRTVDVIGNELIDPAGLDGTPLGECYQAYREMLDRYHFLTFGLIISCTIEALEDPAIFERVQSPLRHLLVDEYQDINPAQERLIELLAVPPVELSVVGDDDQSIYQWRGSDVSNIIEFRNRWPGVTTVELASNRRSRPMVIETANTFALSIPHRLEKSMNPVREAGSNEIVAWSEEREEPEAERIAETIGRLSDLGYRFRDIAVLYRSVRTSAPPLIEALRNRGLPYSCAGRTGLFMQPEVAVFGELFAWFVDGDWRDERFGETRKADFDNIVDGLERGFGAGQPIDDLRKYLEDWKAYQLRGIRPVSLVGDFYQLLAHLGAHEIDVDTPEGSARCGAFARFSKVLADFEHVNRRGRYVEKDGKRTYRAGRDRGKPYYWSLFNYLLHYARDASESVFPARKRRRYEGSEAEERRLFYVALTRARDCAFLSRFERRKNRFRASPFLLEIAGGEVPRRDSLALPDPPEKLHESEAPTLTTSFSDIAIFEECGYRYRLSGVLGYQQELAVALGYGRAVHHVLRRLAETARESGSLPDEVSVQALVEEELYLPFADTPAFIRMRRPRHASSAATSTATRTICAGSERPFELHVPDGTVAGRADVILDEERGQVGSLAIVDYKVSEDVMREERYRRQLAVYTAAGRGEGLNVEAAYLHELRDGTRHEVDVAEAVTAQATETMARAVADIRRGEFMASPEADKCGLCDFLRICRHRHEEAECC